MEIRVAKISEIEVVSSILTESALWLVEKGIPSWKVEDLIARAIEKDVLGGKYHIAFKDGADCACFRYQEDDPEYWGDVPHKDSHFVHRIAIRREFSGKGLLEKLLDFAKEKARNEGKSYLRLDCIDRPKLRAVYEAEGFVFHSEKARSPYNVIRYEYFLN